VRFVVQSDRAFGEVAATSTAAAALPSGFVTLLMTDIEGSTALLRRMGDRYRDLLNEVRVVLRTAVSRAGGREIDVRADEFFAVFERARDAVVAAASLQRELRERSWPEGAEVRVRVGIHSGRPTLTDVGYIGLAVHTAARVSSAAHGGQVLLSGAARNAVEGPASAGVRFRSLGRFRLHGLSDTEALFQLLAKGLRASFPPPRTKGRSRRKA
jgi:class 3 adenylate cyclase